MKIEAIHMREVNMPLAHPFETSFGVTTTRRILLIELECERLSAWGECVAGEHPYFSEEQVDTAWHVIETELAPRLLNAEIALRTRLPGAVRAGARESHGQGSARERRLGARRTAQRGAALQAAGWIAGGDPLRCVDWDSADARKAHGKRSRLRCLPAISGSS